MSTKHDARHDTMRNLSQQLRQLERSRRRPRLAADSSLVFSSGMVAVDRLLPAGGYRSGSLVELLVGGRGSGATTLAASAARKIHEAGGGVVVIDPQGRFYPPAARAWDISPADTIVVYPATATDHLWALDQALRTPAVDAVWTWIERLDPRAYRRLQLAAENSGGVGLLVRPATVLGEPSWCDTQLLVEPVPAQRQRRMRVTVIKCRGGTGGNSVTLEIDEQAGTASDVTDGLAEKGVRSLHSA